MAMASRANAINNNIRRHGSNYIRRVQYTATSIVAPVPLHGVARSFSSKAAALPSTRSVIVKLLQNIASKKEVEQYLKYYSSLDAPKFAVIKVGGGLLLNELDTLADSLAFLSEVGLLPVVVHGAGPQLNEQLKKENIVSDYIGGMRVTTPAILQTARSVFQRENLRLVKALEDRGTRARPIVSGIFSADMLDQAKYGLVGQIKSVDLTPVYHALEAGHLPILTCMGETDSGQYLNVNADVAAHELAKALKPAKIVYLSSNGGLNDASGQLMANVDLDSDYERLMTEPWFKHGDRLKLKEIKTLLDELPVSSSVAITSAANLPKELFTHKGSGTLVRRSERIHCLASLAQVDRQRLRELIQQSFEGELRDDYFDSISGHIHRLYVSENYNAVAIVTKDAADVQAVPYLDKFAVSKYQQSEGTGNTLWQRLKQDIPSLFWRSRCSNVINSWYFERCTGAHKHDQWVVFWYGKQEDTNKLIQAAIGKPPSIERGRPASESPRRSSPPVSALSRARVGLIGARGHTGAEILKILSQHSALELTVASSRALVGQSVGAVFPALSGAPSWRSLSFTDLQPSDLAQQPVDLWILAMPNQLAAPFVERIPAGVKCVDLSADYRFDTAWCYGLPERQGARQRIQEATRIANPGCYATGMQLSLLPLMSLMSPSVAPSIFGVSGYSGAGTSPSRRNDVAQLHDNLMPYSLLGHLHEREVSHQLQRPVHFMPHVASWFRGIALTIDIVLNEDSRRLDRSAIVSLFKQYYQHEPLVRIVEEIPEVRDNALKHTVTIGGFAYEQNSGRLVLTTCIDNLLKGAATQCIQNANITLGFKEFDGIQYE